VAEYAQKRSGKDRRGSPVRRAERRQRQVPVKVERRSGEDRRAEDRRRGRERRKA
jgi:hypothetical protein